jgi:hypothetical protein
LLRSDGSAFATVIYDNIHHELNVYGLAFHQSDREQHVNVEPQPKSEEKNDCMLVATENLHRLTTISAWSNIIRFQVYVNGEHEWGHAMAIWKIKGDSQFSPLL